MINRTDRAKVASSKRNMNTPQVHDVVTSSAPKPLDRQDHTQTTSQKKRKGHALDPATQVKMPKMENIHGGKKSRIKNIRESEPGCKIPVPRPEPEMDGEASRDRFVSFQSYLEKVSGLDRDRDNLSDYSDVDLEDARPRKVSVARQDGIPDRIEPKEKPNQAFWVSLALISAAVVGFAVLFS